MRVQLFKDQLNSVTIFLFMAYLAYIISLNSIVPTVPPKYTVGDIGLSI